ncbi:MAG TPA: MFS transporter [Steroidobacteraceae bacterium]|jgi:EmrB/QacA subfamily drug resistance transporter|nr:MFS transporter [Steroidobacteraceae bacterium]
MSADKGRDSASVAGSGRPVHGTFFAIFPSIMLPMFLAVVDQTIVATALPAIAADTGNVERASWVVVSYLIASTIAAPIYGRLGDAFGRRRLMFAAIFIFILASLFCAASPTVELLAWARVVQGLGGGGLMTLSQALIGEAVPPRERARYQGYLAAVAVCANTFGPVAGGYLTEHFGWRSVFLVNVPIGLIAVLLTRNLENVIPGRSNWRPDPIGLVLFTIFVTTTLLTLEQVQHVDRSALPLLGGLFAASVVSLTLLVRQESRAPSPLIPLSLLRRPTIWRSDALAAFHGAALVSLITFLPIYLEVVRGLSPAATGLLLVPLTIGIGTGSLLTGRLVSKTGWTTVFPVLGLALVTANLVVLALWVQALNETALGWLLLWNGLFMGTVMGVVQVTVQSASGPLRLGEAAASVQFSRSIGAAFGTALVTAVLFAVLSMKNPEAARLFATMAEHGAGVASNLPAVQQTEIRAVIAEAFRAAFLSIAAFTAVGFFLALSIPLRRI